jgi:streptogramin lyase
VSQTWTTTAQFDTGFKVNVDDTNPVDQLQLYPPTDTRPLPSLWIPGSDSGTVYRIDTTPPISQESIKGRYRCGPQGSPVHGNPGRTSVDLYGNCWVGNRQGGSVVRYGLVIGGTRCDANFAANPTGLYLKPPYTYNTCVDRDGDGLLKTSRGAESPVSGNGFDLRPWPNETLSGITTTAEDEAIYFASRPSGADPVNQEMRHISVDAVGDCWAAAYQPGNLARKFYKISGTTGTPAFVFNTDPETTGTVFPGTIGGHGGVVDSAGTLWSTSVFAYHVLRYDGSKLNVQLVPTADTHNMCMDNAGNAWFISFDTGRIHVLNPAGAIIANYLPAAMTGFPRGVAWNFTNNTLWVTTSTGRLLGFTNTGVLVNNYAIGSDLRGITFASATSLWGCAFGQTNVKRFDVTTGAQDAAISLFDGVNVLDADPYAWGNMNGMVTLQTTSGSGFWRVVYDAVTTHTSWTISWTETVPVGTTLTVERRVAATEVGLAVLPFVSAGNGALFAATGQFVEIRVTFRRTAGSSATPILFDITITDTAPVPGAAFISDDYLEGLWGQMMRIGHIQLVPEADISFDELEGLYQPGGTPLAFVSQDCIEGLYVGDTTARISQDVIEGLYSGSASARISQDEIEGLMVPLAVQVGCGTGMSSFYGADQGQVGPVVVPGPGMTTFHGSEQGQIACASAGAGLVSFAGADQGQLACP